VEFGIGLNGMLANSPFTCLQYLEVLCNISTAYQAHQTMLSIGTILN